MQNTKIIVTIVDLRKQIFRRPTWESYSEGFFLYILPLVGVVFGLSLLWYYQCDFLTELRSATLHETVSNYGTHEANTTWHQNYTLVSCSKIRSVSRIHGDVHATASLQLYRSWTLCQKISYMLRNEFSKKHKKETQERNTSKKHNITLDRNNSNAIGTFDPLQGSKVENILFTTE